MLGAILRSLGVNIPCLGVNGVLPRHAEPGADALGSVCVAGMLVAAFLGSRRVNTENSRIWTIWVWRCNAAAFVPRGARDVFHAAVEREPTVTDTACQHAELTLKRVGMFEPSARRQLKVS